MTERLIPVGFEIPNDYRREFIFEDPSVEFRHRIVVDSEGIHIWDTDSAVHPVTASRCLDWIEETMYSVRRELES
jgi:hypothetical protein